jgi:hypothetical protein
MRKTALVLSAALVAGAMAVGAHALTKPGRTRVEGAPIVALSVTGRSVTYAVADNAKNTDCAHTYVWHTAGGAMGKWRFGKPTNEPCGEGTSTGDGISAVAMSAERSLWIQYAGGNLRDWQLYTATRTRTKPRQLAFVEQDVELPSPIVVGQGTALAVPYAVKQNITYLGDNGAAVFKWTAPASVRLLASGYGPGGAQVAAVLDNGTLDLLSRTGQVVQTYAYAPGEVSALFLGPAGVVAQKGSSVEIRKGAKTTTVALPPKAAMIGFGQGRIFYSLAGAIHALEVSDSTDSLLVAATPGKTTLASYATAGGFAWATGNQINWDCAACVSFGA